MSVFKVVVQISLVILLCIRYTFSFATVFTVTNTADAGAGTLREAIILSNTSLGADAILFALPGANWDINLVTPLPVLDDSVTIDGNSQPGSSFPNNMISIYASGANISHAIMLHSHHISILGLKFRYFNFDGCIYSDNLFLGTSTYNKLTISGNVFQDSKYGINIEYYGFRDVIISSNKFWNCTWDNIRYTPKFMSRNVIVTNNEIIGDGSSPYSRAIRFCEQALPFGKISVISIAGNYIRDCREGISISGFTAIDSLEIVSNNIDALVGFGGYGIIFRQGGNATDSCKNVRIDSNTIDSCSGIGFICIGAGDTTIFKNVSVKNNTLYGSIVFRPSGTGTFKCVFSDVLVQDNICPYGIICELGSTGSYNSEMNNISIVGNSVWNVNSNGILLRSTGTGSFSGRFSNVLIRNNWVLGSGGNGIHVAYDCISTSVSSISNVLIDSNIVQASIENGIYIGAGGWNGPGRNINDVTISDNLIYNNTLNGISLEAFNLNPFTGIYILRNSISGNGSQGIFETSGSLYANPKLPEPVLDWVNFQTGLLAGHLKTLPFTTYDVQFYANFVPGNNGHGEGRYYFATLQVATDVNGFAAFQVSIPSNYAGMIYSSTATDVLLNSTSEFSNAIDTSMVQLLSSIPESGLHSFPSPANEFLFINRSPAYESGNVKLFDLTGRMYSKLIWNAGRPELKLDVSTLPEGIYVVHYEGESGVSSAKVVIRH